MDMRANSVNSHMDEADLFVSAVGGRNHGRVRGFGCVLDPRLQKTTRGRATPVASDISGVTNIGNKRVFTDDVLIGMLNERDMRLAEERQERKIEGARCNMLLNKLFTLLGQQNPNVQVSKTNWVFHFITILTAFITNFIYFVFFQHDSLS
jgi:hypothetical protein